MYITGETERRKVFFEERHFLNDEITGSAYIIAQIELHSYDPELPEDVLTYESVTLEIADCVRKINLDFSIGKEYGEKNLKKLDKLIDVLVRFRIQLEKAHKELVISEEKVEEIRKEKEAKK